jgi:hypothetical protein
MDELMGYSPETLQALGVDLEKLKRQQQTQGLLSAGLQLLASSGYSPVRRTTGELLGQAGAAGIGAYQQAGQMGIDQALKNMQIQSVLQRQREAQRIQQLGSQLMQPQKAMVPSADAEAQEGGFYGEQGVNVLPTRVGMNREIANQLMTTPAGMEYLSNVVKTQRELAGKTEVIEIYSPSGQPMKVRYNQDTGDYTPLGGEKAEPFTQIDLGNMVELRTPSGKIVGRLAKGAAPTAPSFTFNEATGLVVNTKTGQVSQPRDEQGNLVDTTQFRKPSEGEQKQIIGVQNTRNAISEFRSELQNFSRLDTLKPKERARIETKYRNMLMQAKEAYNLGVLNGPDLAILEQIIYNPSSIKGAYIGKEGIDAQAQELDRIMANIKTTVQAKGKEVPLQQPGAKQGSATAPPGVSQSVWNVMTPEEKALWQR